MPGGEPVIRKCRIIRDIIKKQLALGTATVEDQDEEDIEQKNSIV